MTQKRFRKLLMSKGYERNAINEIVKNTIKSGKSYAENYKTITALENINISICADAFTNALKQLQKMAVACAKAATAFGETFSDYEVIAHYKTPLTMQNVNDYSVSLNPENIMLVTHKAHNEIHSRFGYVSILEQIKNRAMKEGGAYD